jgi:hypothetical protein
LESMRMRFSGGLSSDNVVALVCLFLVSQPSSPFSVIGRSKVGGRLVIDKTIRLRLINRYRWSITINNR